MNNFISNFVGFEGRLNRQRWWLSAIAIAVVSLVVTLLILPLIGLSVIPSIDPNTSAADIGNVIAATRSKSGWVGLVLFLIFIYPTAAISIKRRHDRNNKGIDVWIYFVLVIIMELVSALGIGMSTMQVGEVSIPVPGPIETGLGVIVGIYAIYLLVVLGFLKGTAGPNNYGPDPLQG